MSGDGKAAATFLDKVGLVALHQGCTPNPKTP